MICVWRFTIMLRKLLRQLDEIQYLQNFKFDPIFSDQTDELESFSLQPMDTTLQKAGNILKLFPKDMTGLSMLDIGCNKGFFCFEAFLRNAEKITGIDVLQNIIRILNEITETSECLSNIEFISGGFSEKLKELGLFDIILFSSSYHYVYTDFLSHDRIFKILSDICKDRVIIELPMERDDNFARSVLEKKCSGEALYAYNYHAILNSASKYFGSVRYVANSGFLRTRDIFLLEKPGIYDDFDCEFDKKENPWTQVNSF